jgi:small-conductance mechanosensitive channel
VLINLYYKEIIATAIVILIAVFIRLITLRLVKRFSQSTHLLEQRSKLVNKYISILITILTIIALFIIWGVEPQNVFTSAYAVLTVMGIALFAQWSIISNITAAIILFFAFPFKIGDYIRIHDHEFQLEGEIEDIRAFHTLLRTKNGEIITYPNNMMLQKGITIVTEPAIEKEFTD